MFQTGLQNRSNMDPQIAPKLGSKMAPQAGLWGPWGGQDRFWSDFEVRLVLALKCVGRFECSILSLESPWVTFGDHFGIILGCFLGPNAGSRFSEKSIKPIEKTLFLRFGGVEIEAKTDPETASGRDWAARESWEGTKIGPERGPEASCFLDRFSRKRSERPGFYFRRPFGASSP